MSEKDPNADAVETTRSRAPQDAGGPRGSATAFRLLTLLGGLVAFAAIVYLLLLV